ncbi:immunoglobulin-like domain-containing protein [Pelagirhabdus alkalitolerans]|nr:immunoglobulin-like domain-containing protein [Pelagirhabdus alkalitolerans]
MRWLHVSLFIMVSLIFLTACGEHDRGSFSADELEKGEKEVSSLIGSTEVESIIDDSIDQSMIQDPKRIAEHTNLPSPTYEWFMGNGEGVFGYGLTQGQKQPGESFSVQLIAHEAEPTDFNQEVRIQLYELSDTLEIEQELVSETVMIEKVDENTMVYEGNLPDEVNSRYLLTMDILSEDGEVEDSMLGVIVVPKEEMNAELILDKELYDHDDEAELTLKNYGPTTLTLGMSYTIEKNIDDEWYVIPLDLAFIQIALMLAPGEMHEQTVDLSELSPGHYRVIKRINVEGYPSLQTPIGAEFMIE